MIAGETFFLNSRNVEGGHPKVFACDPHNGRIAYVSLTGWESNKDQSCILDPGDEPVLSKRSIVSYRDAKVVLVSQIEEFRACGSISLGRRAVCSETLKKIMAGFGKTRMVDQDVLEFLDKQGLIPVV